MSVDVAETEAAIGESIARKTCIRAVYNRASVLLAPHSIIWKHEEPYVRAVTLEHEGRKPREARLGTFKLSGLSSVEATRKLFSPSSVFAPLLDETVGS